jgi:hypothetical protein
MAGPARRGGSVALAIAGLTIAAASLVACSEDDSAADPMVVTFEVIGGERFKARLTDPVDIAVAQQLLAGEDAPSIPNGLVVRGVTDVNEGYTWSLDPDDFEFADVTIEVCDGIPSDVEAGLVTSERYCPWSAIVVSVDPAS